MKELSAPSKIALSEERGERETARRQYQGNARRVESVGEQLGVESDGQVFTHVKCLKKIRQDIDCKVTILYVWLLVKSANFKGWDHG